MGILYRGRSIFLVRLMIEHDRPFHHHHGEKHGNDKRHDKVRISASNQTHGSDICQFLNKCQVHCADYTNRNRCEIDHC